MSQRPEAKVGLALLLWGEGWKRRIALWSGAIVVALAAIVFARASDAAFHVFGRVMAVSPWWALVLTPGMFALLAWLTTQRLQATRGSGIPQVIAALQLPQGWRERHLSLGISIAKLG